MCLFNFRWVHRRIHAACGHFKRRRAVTLVAQNRALPRPVTKTEFYQLPEFPLNGISKRDSKTKKALRKSFEYANHLRLFIAEDENVASFETSLKALDEQRTRITDQKNEGCERMKQHRDWLESFHKTTRYLESENQTYLVGVGHHHPYIACKRRIQGIVNTEENIAKESHMLLKLECRQESIDGQMCKLGPNDMRYENLENDSSELKLQLEAQKALIERYRQDVQSKRESLHTREMQRLLRNFDLFLEVGAAEEPIQEEAVLDTHRRKRKREKVIQAPIPFSVLREWKDARLAMKDAEEEIKELTGHGNFRRCCKQWCQDEKSQGSPEALWSWDERVLRWSLEFARLGREAHSYYGDCLWRLSKAKNEAMAAGIHPVELDTEIELATGDFDHAKDGMTGSAISKSVSSFKISKIEQWKGNITPKPVCGRRIDISEPGEFHDPLSIIPTSVDSHMSDQTRPRVITQRLRSYQKVCQTLRGPAEALRLKTMTQDARS